MIRDRALPAHGVNRTAWLNLTEHLESVSGTPGFHDYIRGAVTVHATRRLLRYSKCETLVLGAPPAVGSLAKFIRHEVFPGIAEDLSNEVARRALDAAAAAEEHVNKSTRRAVLGGARVAHCYLCNRQLDPLAKEPENSFASMEHLWPRSMGGDSIEDNLLPACKRCQAEKEDSLSWEWLNVHDLVLPANPSPDALKSVRWSARIARHYLLVSRECERSNLTLRGGFLKVGPISTLMCPQTRMPVTFFDLRTTD